MHIMDFELHPAVSLKSRSFNVLVAPRQTFIEMLNRNPNLQRFKILYVSGNFSSILSRLHRTFTELEVRRGFTTFQIMTILEEAHHSLIIIEHDPIIYEDSVEMVEYVSKAMKEASQEATVLLYSPGLDPFMEELAKNSDHIFYFEEGPRDSPRLLAKSNPKIKNQATLEAFS
jgi:DNA polymerase I